MEIVHHATGERFITFAEEGAAGEVMAPRVRAGDLVSILSWGWLHDGQTLGHTAKLVTVDPSNHVVAIVES